MGSRALLAVAAVFALSCDSGRGTPNAPPESPPPSERPPDPPPLASGGCGLPPSGPWQRCPYQLPQFAFDVNEAIAQVENEVPELFDFEDSQGGLSFRVLDPVRYHEEVVARLEGMGFCAVWDGEEVGLKNTNDFNEQYQVMTSLRYVRWGGGAYRSTCYPAWF
jgi:hypothetical protein